MSEHEGRCECGCGTLTPLARCTDAAKGWVKGQPLRFVKGHNGRSRANLRPGVDWIEQQRGYLTPCDIWQGKAGNGYGYVTHEGRSVKALRVRYEREVGPIPAGYELDHLCRVPICVKPQHAEPVTHAENMARSGPATKTHCKHNHLFTAENTYRSREGWRSCLICRRESKERRKARAA